MVRCGQPGSFRGIGGSAESVRTHVSDAGGLPSSARGGHCRWRIHGVRGPTGNEAPTNFTGGVKVTPSKRPGASDGITGSTVCRGLRLERDQDALSAVRRPGGDDTTVGFAEGLRGGHWSILAPVPVPVGLSEPQTDRADGALSALPDSRQPVDDQGRAQLRLLEKDVVTGCIERDE